MKIPDCLYIFLYGGSSYVTDVDSVGCGCYQFKHLFLLLESECMNMGEVGFLLWFAFTCFGSRSGVGRSMGNMHKLS